MDLIEFKQVQQDFKRHPWEQARLKILLSFFKKLIPQKKTVADIGSGDAFIAKSLASTFSQSLIFAVDINYSELIKESLRENDLKNLSFTSSLHSIEQQTPSINLVLLMDVLEHIEKPGDFLEEIKNLSNITASTYFFITVPALQALFTKHDTALGHYKRYNRKELSMLLLSHGMEIKFIGYFFSSLALIRAIQKKFQMDFSKDGLYNWKRGQFLTSFITGLLWIDFKICWYLSRLRIYIPGLTCYCLCHPLQS